MECKRELTYILRERTQIQKFMNEKDNKTYSYGIMYPRIMPHKLLKRQRHDRC